MNPPDLRRSLILRHMKYAKGFVRAEPGTLPPVEPPESETVIGWYCEPTVSWRATLLFTDQALHILRDEKVLRWGELVSVETPEKTATHGLEILTQDGPVFVPIAGNHLPESGAKDAFSLLGAMLGMLRM